MAQLPTSIDIRVKFDDEDRFKLAAVQAKVKECEKNLQWAAIAWALLLILILCKCSSPQDRFPLPQAMPSPPSLSGSLTAAQWRLHRASGVWVETSLADDGCVPGTVCIYVVPELGRASTAGQTDCDWRGCRILVVESRIDSPCIVGKLMHELIHAAGVLCRIGEDPLMCHADERGNVMRQTVSGKLCLNEADLELLCAEAKCTKMVPEC